MGTEHTGTQKQVFEKEKNRRDRLAAFFYDLAKLTFAGTILTNVTTFMSVTPIGIANIVVLVFGFLATTIFAWIGNRLLIY